MTPEQAFTVLDALLSTLESLQQRQHSTSPRPSGDISRRQREESFSFESISQAIWTFGNNDARSTLQEFFDTVLSSLTTHIAESTGKSKDMMTVLESQLDIINKVMYATYHAWMTPKRDFCESGSVSELEMLFGSFVSQLLQPLWVLSLRVRQQQEDMGRSPGDEKSSEIQLSGFTDLAFHVVRIFDEALLPMHLSSQCDEDVIHLVVGLLALLQIFKSLGHVHLVPVIQDQLLSGLLSSGIIERALRSLQTMPSNTAAATCERFIAHLLCLGRIFCESVPEDAIWEINAGDILPNPSVLTTFRLDDIPSYLVARSNHDTDQEEQDRIAYQRWAIAFSYLQLRYHRSSGGEKGVWEAIPILFASEKGFDHLYGVSWVQLAFIYVTLDRDVDPAGMECRPFSLVVILEGLQYSVQGVEEGSLSYAMLKLHVEEVLVWFWSHDCDTYLQEYAAKDPPNTVLGM
ncbi:hypothetical protein BGZ96_012344, partial [Linnemannia gamsii]